MNQRQIEIFTADCPLCDETVNTVGRTSSAV